MNRLTFFASLSSLLCTLTLGATGCAAADDDAPDTSAAAVSEISPNEAITLANWRSHPKILVASREAEAGAIGRSVPICWGAVEVTRSADGKAIRQITVQGLPANSGPQLESGLSAPGLEVLRYDATGRLRTYEAFAPGAEEPSRLAFFATSGARLIEVVRGADGSESIPGEAFVIDPGYESPEAWVEKLGCPDAAPTTRR